MIIVGVIVSLAGAVIVGMATPEAEGPCTVIQPACFCVTDENGVERCVGCETTEVCDANRIAGVFAGFLTFVILICVTIWIANRVPNRR